MPALANSLPPAAHHAQGALPTPSRLLSKVTQNPAIGAITDGLAQVLGFAPQTPAQPPQQRVDPAFAGQAVTPDRQTAGLTVEQMLQSMQPSAASIAAEHVNLETLRMEMFGRYYQEMEARMTELRQVIDGGVARARRAMLERVDELGAALHRDMVALRQETQREIEDLKRDVFTTVMSLSAINDKLCLADSRNRETWVAVTKALTDRIDQQARSQGEMIEAFRKGIDEGMEARVVRVVEGTLMKLAAARKHPTTAPVPTEAATA